MKLNARLRIKVSSEMLEKLKKEAREQEITLTELCREKLKGNSNMDRLESVINKIENILIKNHD